MPLLAVTVAIIDAGRILLVKREDYEVWCLPGGFVEAGESVAQAAIREAREETGLEIQLTRIVGVYSRPYWQRGGIHLLLFAGQPVGGALALSDETLDVRYFADDELPEPLLWGHRQQILDALAESPICQVWTQNMQWPLANDLTHHDVYALRDQSHLSRREFYTRYLQVDEQDQRRDVDDPFATKRRP